MAVYRRSRRHRFMLFLLVLTSVTVITLDFRGGNGGFVDDARGAMRDLFAPVQSAAERVFAPVGDFFGGIARYGDVKAENEQLRRELEEARIRNLRQAGSARELEKLRSLHEFTFAANVPAIAARVVATSPSNFQLTVTIDRGSDDQVAAGMPVVAGEGLVGRVVHVSRARATVLLITDPSSNVGVRFQSSGEVGVAKGSGPRDPLSVDLVDVETKVDEGEAVVTSGLQGSVFPPDVPVGRVRSARVPPGALQKEITVDPVVDLRKLEFVKVLRWGSQP